MANQTIATPTGMGYNNTVSWMQVPEPTTRGTFRLLTGCMITLSLCVYTSVHLNVPPKLHTKIKWILYGMFAPELVLFTAWCQWMSARRLTIAVNKILLEKDQSKQGVKDIEWTMTHSFFAQMGGFAFETDSFGEEYIRGSPRLRFTANGVLALARLGKLPTISKEAIEDKSKADGFAKTLVTLQTAWLFLQCIGRVIAKLPITLLELNTVAHVICAIIMTILWWKKPLSISEPYVLQGDWIPSVSAAMWMFSKISTEKERIGKSKEVLPREMERLIRIERRNISFETDSKATRTSDVVVDIESGMQDTGISSSLVNDESLSAISSTRPLMAPHNPISTGRASANDTTPQRVKSDRLARSSVTSRFMCNLELTSGIVLQPFGFSVNPESRLFHTRNISKSKVPRYWTPPVKITVDRVTWTRWQLATRCFDEYPAIWEQHKTKLSEFKDSEGTTWVRYQHLDTKRQKNYVAPEVRNWPGKDLVWDRKSPLSIFFFFACASIYGGIHASAWNGHFPTDTEKLLWRISTGVVSGSALLYPLNLLYDRMTDILRYLKVFGPDSKSRGCCASCLCGCVAGFVASVEGYSLLGIFGIYIFSRSFLVIEAFISLRALAPAMYQTPSWTQYLSHL